MVPERILLIGMMGSGKTTVALELARLTGWPSVDNDDLFRDLTGRASAEIAGDDGEDALHEAEAAALLGAIELPTPRIVGVAGAMIERPKIRRLLSTAGHVVWLRAQPGTLHTRIGTASDRRADAADPAWLAATAAERDPLYRALADQVIDVDDLGPAGIAEAILAAIGFSSAG